MGVTITYPNTLPSLNDPSTFNDRALDLFGWITGNGGSQLLGQLENMDANDFFTVQSSAYDDTSGRVLTVNAFGLGNFIQSIRITVADDAVGTITAPSTGGWCAMVASDDGQAPSGQHSATMYYDVGSTSPSIYKMNTTPIGDDVDVSSVLTLTGTDGTDGNVTVATTAGDGTITIENRSGSSRTFRVTFY